MTGLLLGSVTIQVTVPVGVIPGPVTVAVKLKLPPVSTPEELSITEAPEEALPTSAVVSEPKEPL